MEILSRDSTVDQYGCYGGKDGGTGYDARDPSCAGGLVEVNGVKSSPCIHSASCWAVTAQNYVTKHIAPASLVRKDNGPPRPGYTGSGGGAPFATYGGNTSSPAPQAPPQAAVAAPVPRGKSAAPMQGEGTSYGAVHFQPVTTESNSYLKESEDRRKGKKIRAAFAEGARGGIKGALTQLAAFVNEVPWFEDD